MIARERTPIENSARYLPAIALDAKVVNVQQLVSYLPAIQLAYILNVCASYWKFLEHHNLFT